MLGKRAALCAACKGSRRLCGRAVCPILERIASSLEVLPSIKGASLFASTPPSVLVGERGYPRVRVGVNVPPVRGWEAAQYDDPVGWWGRLRLSDIIRLRARLVFSSTISHVRAGQGRALEAIREAALSSLPVDTEVYFKKPPRVELKFDGVLAPRGPLGEIERVRVVENPRVPRPVQRLVEDTDAPATDAVIELYRAKISVYQIVRLFTLGMLGQAHRRRIVPTRWAITAVDKLLSDHLLQIVSDCPEISSFEVYRIEYLGNRYTLLLAPGPWSMQMVEVWLPGSVWVPGETPSVFSVHELHDGRLRGPMDGGYYAIRLPVLEHLARRGRKASIIVVREITPQYYAPVGSWQIRESVRNALTRRPERFSDLEEAVQSVLGYLSRHARSALLSQAPLFNRLRFQRRITDYLKA